VARLEKGVEAINAEPMSCGHFINNCSQPNQPPLNQDITMGDITKRRRVSLVGAGPSKADSALCTAATAESVAHVHESKDKTAESSAKPDGTAVARLEKGAEAINAEAMPSGHLINNCSQPNLPPLNQLLKRALKKCDRAVAAANNSKELSFVERGLTASRIRQELSRLKEFPMLVDLRREEEALSSQGMTKRLEASAMRKFLEKYEKAQVHLSMFAKCLTDD
jgi:hypothetical protein